MAISTNSKTSLSTLFDLYGFTINKLGDEKTTTVRYQLQSPSRGLTFTFSWLAESDFDNFMHLNIDRFISILLNGAILETRVYDVNQFKDLINRHYVRLTPSMKLDSILEWLSANTQYEGQAIKIDGPKLDEAVQRYFANVSEWWFYFISAKDQGFIRTVGTDDFAYDEYGEIQVIAYGLTVEGLTRLSKVGEGKASQHCFVAMSFAPELADIYYQAIAPALVETGFKPIRVDQSHIPSDQTINDEIIAGIKKSRFTIADFTNHANGVYFEAGYALGAKKSVIYSCRKDQMDKAHFDIRNYQHIVWETIPEFKIKLVDKINAFIKES